jgi:hypothetical protein
MPFKKRDGNYFFEAVEVFSKDHFPKEYEAQFLALCPLCAAKYKELIKLDANALENLKSSLTNTSDLEIPLTLGDETANIRFVETHISDLRTILREVSP